jgi:protein disulfide-isomerase A1
MPPETKYTTINNHHQVPGVDIKSFPTLKFWKNGHKEEAIAFTGERDLKGILKFIEDNTSHPWVELTIP